MLNPFVFSSFQCTPIARLSRAIYEQICSCLAGTQFDDCMTCLANIDFVLVCTNYQNLTSLLMFLSFNISVYVSFPCFISFHPTFHHIGSAEPPWIATQRVQPY